MPADPGTHELVATAPGAEEQRKTVTLGEGQTQRVSFEIEVTEPPKDADLPGPSDPKPEPSGSKALTVVGWTAVGLGAVGLGVADYLWADSSSLQSQADREAAECGPSCPEPRAGQIRQMDTNAADQGTTAATLGGISGGVLLAGIVMILVDGSRGDEGTASLSPVVAPSWVGVSGRF
jgi:hypothetical protein